MEAESIAQARCVPDDTTFSASVTLEAVVAKTGLFPVRRRSTPASMTEFVGAVRTLAAVLAANAYPGESPQQQIEKIWATDICCPREFWERSFGEPDGELDFERQSTGSPFYVGGTVAAMASSDVSPACSTVVKGTGFMS